MVTKSAKITKYYQLSSIYYVLWGMIYWSMGI